MIGMRSSGGRRAVANEHTCRRATGAGVAAGGRGRRRARSNSRTTPDTDLNQRPLPAPRLVLPPRPPSVHCPPKVVQQFARPYTRLAAASATGAPRVPTRNSRTTPSLFLLSLHSFLPFSPLLSLREEESSQRKGEEGRISKNDLENRIGKRERRREGWNRGGGWLLVGGAKR